MSEKDLVSRLELGPRLGAVYTCSVFETGSFAMTDMEDECVIAMKMDAGNEFLLAGDTAGFIAIFNIKNYCTSDEVQLCSLQCP